MNCYYCESPILGCVEYSSTECKHIYTHGCGCTTGSWSITDKGVESWPCDDWDEVHKYGMDRAKEVWREEMFKKENPDSESEAGVDADKVWDATLDAMRWAYTHGWQQCKVNQGYDRNSLRARLEMKLKEYLKEFI